MDKSERQSKVDGLAAQFTKGLLRLARREKVDFDAVGPKGSKTAEVLAVLRENTKVADRLMTK
jgi:hypothetical protein